MELVLVTGLSGAGKSRAAAVLEDFDYYCVDNMPISMIPRFAELCVATRGRYERTALVSDIRSIEDFDELFQALDTIKKLGIPCRILFIEAKTETIVRRYKETRRRHPLSPDGKDLLGAVSRERDILSPLRDRADLIIDTTGLTIGRLQRKLYDSFMSDTKKQPITVTVMSFGYKNGLPIEADLVMDARFLPNPYYVAELKNKNGLDREVSDYVFSFSAAKEFLEKTVSLLTFLLPYYIEEGKTSLTLAVGCTGGHHRSVAAAERIGKELAAAGYEVVYRHRDIGSQA